MRFPANCETKEMTLNLFQYMVCGRCPVIRIIGVRGCSFTINVDIFRHLELEIAISIPSPNDEKWKQTIQQHNG